MLDIEYDPLLAMDIEALDCGQCDCDYCERRQKNTCPHKKFDEKKECYRKCIVKFRPIGDCKEYIDDCNCC